MQCPRASQDAEGTDILSQQETDQADKPQFQTWISGAGGGLFASPQYRLRVHIGQPVAPAVRQSPNYRLLVGQGP